MKEIPISNVEKDFILKAISKGKRIDGRDTYDYRDLRITFGSQRGCCEVQLGLTRVITQVSCEVQIPTSSKPTQGMLYVNLELSPMASPAFETGRLSEYGVELNRLLERSIRDSKAVDLESLCIVAGEKVWQIRIDIHTLNHDGNLLDCSSIAGIAALHHFRRPDVTVSGEEVTIHPVEDRDPVPLSIHHMPVCVTFAFFKEGTYLLVDPLEREERVMDGTMVVCMNIHRELCTVQMTGSMLIVKDQVLRCCKIAVVKVTEITEVIKKALENDATARKEGKKFGFAEWKPSTSIRVNKIAGVKVSTNGISEAVEEVMAESMEDDDDDDGSQDVVEILTSGTGSIGEGFQNTWVIPDSDDDDDEGGNAHAITSADSKDSVKEAVHQADDSDDSEEEAVVLNESEFRSKSQERNIHESSSIDLSVALKRAQNADPGSTSDGFKKARKKLKKKRQVSK